MKNHLQFRKGDITLLVTMLVCLTIIILLLPIANKITVESKISKENLMSQQAVQAAKTGLDAWRWNFNQPGITKPEQVDTSETLLDLGLGIYYQVEYFPAVGTAQPYLVSTGRVKRDSGTWIIERTLEEVFNPSRTTTN